MDSEGAGEIAAGRVVGSYVLEERLGRGAFGEVWRARHRDSAGVQAAVKVATNPDVVRTIRREGSVQFSLRHPGILLVHHFDLEADPPHLVMDLAPGGSLRDLLARQGRLPVPRALAIFSRVLDAVEYAHAQGVIHRDLKPENVLFLGEDAPVIADFGLGVLLGQARESLLLSGAMGSRGEIAGTFDYMPREQREGMDLDPRADIYALGVILFEMLTGGRPELGEVPSESVPGLPRALDRVYLRCVARIDRRLRTVAELRRALEAEEPAEAPEEMPGEIELAEEVPPEAAAHCDACGASLPADARHCDRCGARIPRRGRYCDECGASADADAEFCVGCGVSLP